MTLLILSSCHRFTIQSIKLTERPSHVAASAQVALNKRSGVILKCDVARVARAQVGAVERRQRVKKEVAADLVQRRVEPGLAVAGLATTERIHPTLAGWASHKLRVFKRWPYMPAAGRDRQAGSAQRRSQRPAIEAYQPAESQRLRGILRAGVVRVAIRKRAIHQLVVARQRLVGGDRVAIKAGRRAQAHQLAQHLQRHDAYIWANHLLGV